MIPYDEEDKLRIKKHINSRSGLGFKTLECPYDLNDSFCNEKNHQNGTFLIESLTSLLANTMFANEKMNLLPCSKIIEMLTLFIQKTKNCIFVCDSIFSDGQ